MILRSSLAYVKEETFAQTQSIGFAPSWRRLGPKSALSVGRRYSQPLRDEYRPPSPQRRRRVRRPPVPSAMSPGAVLKFQLSCVRVIQAAASAVLLGRVLLPALSAGHPHTPLSESTRRSRDERDRLPPWAVSLDFSPRHPSEPGDLSNQGEFTWQASRNPSRENRSRGAESITAPLG